MEERWKSEDDEWQQKMAHREGLQRSRTDEEVESSPAFPQHAKADDLRDEIGRFIEGGKEDQALRAYRDAPRDACRTAMGKLPSRPFPPPPQSLQLSTVCGVGWG